MDTLRELDVVRALPPTSLVRATDAEAEPSDVLGVLHGHFSVFDSWYPIRSFWEGEFLESVAPGAFRKTMAERRDQIVVAFDHGFDPQIGDKVLGPIDDLREDGQGAAYEVGLLDTSYNRDLFPALKRGLYGSSFRFQVIKDEWDDEPERSDYNPDGLPERVIREVRLFEFGPVTYPASPAATAGMRSVIGMTDSFYERLSARDPQRVDSLRSRLVTLRGALVGEKGPELFTPPTGGVVLDHSTPDPEAAAAGTAEGEGAARTTDAEPTQNEQGHSTGLSSAARSRLLAAPFLADRRIA